MYKQSYTTTLPKNLWLAVNEVGVHILKRRAKDPLISYSYRNIVNYSPSLRNLMIVTESLTRGTKFVFNTSQVKGKWDCYCIFFLICLSASTPLYSKLHLLFSYHCSTYLSSCALTIFCKINRPLKSHIL